MSDSGISRGPSRPSRPAPKKPNSGTDPKPRFVVAFLTFVADCFPWLCFGFAPACPQVCLLGPRPQKGSVGRGRELEPADHGGACVLRVVDAELPVDLAPGHGAIDRSRIGA